MYRMGQKSCLFSGLTKVHCGVNRDCNHSKVTKYVVELYRKFKGIIFDGHIKGIPRKKDCHFRESENGSYDKSFELRLLLLKYVVAWDLF